MEMEFELVGEMGLYAKAEVEAGFSSDEQIVERAIRRYAGQGEYLALRDLARELVGFASGRHLLRQREWPLVTDCDRLELAFGRLGESGIVCRQNFHADDRQGLEAIDEEMDREEAAGRKVRGYAYYHRRDIDLAIAGGGLFLSYGASDGEADDDDGADLGIGAEVVEALRHLGLKPQWSGEGDARIHLPLQWQRRRAWIDD